MQWKFSPEQDDYREALSGWLSDAAASEKVRVWLGTDGDPAGDAAAFERLFEEVGMSGVGLSEEVGGQGGGVVELAITAEELARAAVPSARWLATVLAVQALGDQPDLATEALAQGAALVVTADGPPAAAAGLSVVGGRLSGTVSRVLGAERAGVLLVPVGGRAGQALAVVRMGDQSGVTLTPRRLLDRSREVADVVFDEAACTVVPLADDWADSVGALAAVLVAADALGAMDAMLSLAVTYSGQRQQFGVPIGSFQAVKHAAAQILVDVEAARSGVYFAAASVAEGGREALMHASALKAQATAAAVRAADAALTMHGAIGYTWEHDLHLFYKRAHLDEQLFGAPSVWNERIATELLGAL